MAHKSDPCDPCKAKERGLACDQARHDVKREDPLTDAVDYGDEEPVKAGGYAAGKRLGDAHPVDWIGDHPGYLVQKVRPGKVGLSKDGLITYSPRVPGPSWQNQASGVKLWPKKSNATVVTAPTEIMVQRVHPFSARS